MLVIGTQHVSLKLREGAKQYHFQLQKSKKTLKKELERTCELGALKWQPESEWVSPLFIMPKQSKAKQNCMICQYFSKVNTKLQTVLWGNDV